MEKVVATTLSSQKIFREILQGELMKEILVLERNGTAVAVYVPLREVGIGKTKEEAVEDLKLRIQKRVADIKEYLIQVLEEYRENLCDNNCYECPFWKLARTLNLDCSTCPDVDEVLDTLFDLLNKEVGVEG